MDFYYIYIYIFIIQDTRKFIKKYENVRIKGNMRFYDKI